MTPDDAQILGEKYAQSGYGGRMPDLTRVTVSLPKDVAARLRALARGRRRSVSYVVREAIESWCFDLRARPSPLGGKRRMRDE
jgi:class 3 adenylate cyclase